MVGGCSTDRPANDDQDVGDEQLFQVFAELERKRATETPVETEPQSFRTKLLGSKWLIRERAKAADAWQGVARAPQAEEWCGRYGLNKSARFEIALYGDANAIRFARSWCHKTEYFYRKWVAAGGDKYHDSAHDLPAYEELEAFTQAARGLSGQQAARAAQLRALAPR